MTNPTATVPSAPRRRRRIGEARSRSVSVKMTPSAYERIRVAAEANEIAVTAYIAEAASTMAQTQTITFVDDHPARAFVEDLDRLVRKLGDLHDAVRSLEDALADPSAGSDVIAFGAEAGERISREAVTLCDRLIARYAA